MTREEILSCTIIVSGASAWMEPYHDRMPVLLEEADFDAWLDGSLSADALKPARNPHCANGACRLASTKAEAYLRLRTLPGEEGQVDWGHFGHLEIGRARRPLMAFVMVLSYSRQIFLRFFLDARMENFLRGHIAAFEAWQGVPRVAVAFLQRRFQIGDTSVDGFQRLGEQLASLIACSLFDTGNTTSKRAKL